MVDQGGLELCRQQFQRPCRVRDGEDGSGYEVFELSLDGGGLTFSHFWCRRISAEEIFSTADHAIAGD